MFGLRQEDKDKLNEIYAKIGQVDFFFQNYDKFLEFGRKCSQTCSIIDKLTEEIESISCRMGSWEASVNSFGVISNSLLEQKDYFKEHSEQIEKSNHDYQKKMKTTQDLINELHGTAGIVRSILNDKKNMDFGFTQLSLDFSQKIDRLEAKIDQFIKEYQDEKSKKKRQVKVRKSKESPQGGHEDVPKRKRGRPKAVKKAEEVK